MATTNLTNLKANALTNVVSTILSTTNIVSSGSAPKISSITYPGDDTAAATAGGQTVTLTGTGFNSGASVIINGSYAGVVTVVSSTTITFTAPANVGGTYPLYVVNTDGGTAISIPGISYSGTPSWSTAAGSIATLYETSALSNTVTATGDATISYSLYSGTLPPGSSLNTTTGLISGTSEGVGGSTTYTFTIRATDGQNQDTDRTFTITINPDAVTWSSPADNSTVTAYEYSAISPVTMSATSAAGKSITYTANTLPTGVLISGNTISGTPTVVANTNTLLTANAANTFKTATRNINFVVNQDVVTWSSPADGTTTSLNQNTPMTNVALSATSAAGQSVSYAANALPTGVTISGSNVTGTPTVIGNTTSVITATAANTNRTATRTFYWTVSVASDTYFKNTTLLLNGETTANSFINDASSNSFALTITGDTKPVLYNPYQGDGYYSNSFDGASWVLGTLGSSVTIGTSDFCFEGWGYWTSFNFGTYGAPLASLGGATAGELMIRATKTTANTTSANFFNIVGASTYIPSSMFSSGVTVGTLYLNRWHHLAVQRVSGTWYFYVDGVMLSSTSTGDASLSLAFTKCYIGNDLGSGNGYMAGNVSNVRLVVGSAPYATAGFTPPTVPLTNITNTKFLSAQSNRYIDNSVSASVFTTSGSPSVSPIIPFSADSSYSTYGSAYFDGSGDYIDVTGIPVAATGQFTIEAWIYTNKVNSATNQMIYSQYNTSDSNRFTININTSNKLQVTHPSGNITGATTITPYQWNHIAVTRDASNTLRIFLNGVVDVSSSNWTNSIFQTNARIGYYPNTPLDYFNGYMSNLRVLSGTALYTSAFTPPSTPLTAVSNTSLLTLQSNGGITNQSILDNSNYYNIITRNGNASQGTFSPYSVTGWSNYFNGSSTYLASPSSTTNAFGTGDYTIEFWCYSNSLGSGTAGSPFYVDMSGYQQLIRHNGSVWECYYKSGVAFTTVTIPTGNIKLGEWTHHALVRNSGVVKWFINGVLYGSAADTTNFSTTTYFQMGMYANYFYDGYVSNVRVVKGTAVYTTASTTIGATIFTPPTSPLTAISGTIFLTAQSNRFIDNGPLNQTISITSTPSVQAFNPFGSISEATPLSYSNYFDGTGDYLTIPTNAAFTFGTGDFTIEGWFYMVSTTSGTLFDNRTGTTSVHPVIYYTGSNFSLYVAGSGVITGSSAVANQWYHVAVSRVSSSTKMFINGVQVGSTYTDTNNYATSGTVNIGAGLSAGNLLNGYISNLRVVKGAGLYSSTFTPSTTPLTTTSQGATASQVSLLTCQSTRIIDNSRNAFTITAAGDVKPRPLNPFGYTAQTNTSYTPSLHGGSVYFDGSGDYLSVAHTTNHWLTNQDFTIEAWFYCTRGAVGDQTIISKQWQGSSAAYASYNIYIEQTTGTIRFLASTSGGAWEIDSGSSTYTLKSNQWQHVAVTRSGSTFRLFINGILDKTVTNSGSLYNHPDPLLIGAAGALVGYSGGFQGYLSDVRIVKNVSIYNANFYPSLSPLTSTHTIGTTTSNSILLVNGVNGGIVDQHSGVVLETVGDARLSTSIKKYNNASMYFDGTGDYLLAPGLATYTFGTGDFTIEAWIYRTDTGVQRGIVDNSAGTSNRILFYITSNNKLNLFDGSTVWLSSTNTVPANQWVHVAVTRASGTTKLFIGGTQEASSSDTRNYIQGSAGLYIGRQYGSTTSDFMGYIDDLRITNGYARYTGNFTPPTALLIK